jgi:hypothetical protein
MGMGLLFDSAIEVFRYSFPEWLRKKLVTVKKYLALVYNVYATHLLKLLMEVMA